MGFASSPISYPTTQIPPHQVITWTIVFVGNISKLILFLYVMFYVLQYHKGGRLQPYGFAVGF
jgi:hypothetical protein